MLFEIRDIKFCNSEFPGISYLMHILILFLLFQCQSDCLIKSFIMMLSSYSLFLCLLKTLLVLVKKHVVLLLFCMEFSSSITSYRMGQSFLVKI